MLCCQYAGTRCEYYMKWILALPPCLLYIHWNTHMNLDLWITYSYVTPAEVSTRLSGCWEDMKMEAEKEHNRQACCPLSFSTELKQSCVWTELNEKYLWNRLLTTQSFSLLLFLPVLSGHKLKASEMPERRREIWNQATQGASDFVWNDQ